MRYKLRQTDNTDLVHALHTICLPSDEFPSGGQLWVCHADDGTPVAFCSACVLPAETGTVFLSSAGVLPCARGQGLQRRMIYTRLNWARTQDATHVITYTVYDNYASIINLLDAGFKFYDPRYRWAGNVNYFIKELQ